MRRILRKKGLMRSSRFITNVFLSVPQLPVVIVIGAFWGQSIWNIILIVSAFSWASIAKQVRAKVMSVKNRKYVVLARGLRRQSVLL